jgi:hypothetical protein
MKGNSRPGVQARSGAQADRSRQDEVYQFLQGFIRAQYAANVHVTLSQIAHRDCGPYHIHPDLVSFFTRERQRILPILQAELERGYPDGEGIVDLFVSSTREYIYQNNQFITLSPADQWELAGLYLEFVADMAETLARAGHAAEIEDRFQAAMERHLAALHAFTLRLEREHGAGGSSLIHSQVACKEYSPDLQLEVLGINVNQLAEPILDVGCGKRGELVHHLRRAGIKVVGMDRLVQDSPYLVEADWLQARFEPCSWGTIVSHMAFSNHFRFHHLYRHGVPGAYAAKFVEMLSWLKPGGAFYYAPGLPFIEALLPPGYQLAKKVLDVPGWSGAELVREEMQPVAQERFYSTRITRMAKEKT